MILLFLVCGLVIGAVVGIVVPGRTPSGWGMSMVIGAAGAMVGGLLASALGLNTEGARAGLFMAALGAVSWLALYHLIRHRAGLRRDTDSHESRPYHGHRRSTDEAPSTKSG